ncbi:hypothetical protein BJ742DRAFT_813382 [Cladochytrium replicatum]|nr:hypothetical protein BJ742DRAFT_813382 [Cladochytrium replicatum]
MDFVGATAPFPSVELQAALAVVLNSQKPSGISTIGKLTPFVSRPSFRPIDIITCETDYAIHLCKVLGSQTSVTETGDVQSRSAIGNQTVAARQIGGQIDQSLSQPSICTRVAPDELQKFNIPQESRKRIITFDNQELFDRQPLRAARLFRHVSILFAPATNGLEPHVLPGVTLLERAERFLNYSVDRIRCLTSESGWFCDCAAVHHGECHILEASEFAKIAMFLADRLNDALEHMSAEDDRKCLVMFVDLIFAIVDAVISGEVYSASRTDHGCVAKYEIGASSACAPNCPQEVRLKVLAIALTIGKNPLCVGVALIVLTACLCKWLDEHVEHLCVMENINTNEFESCHVFHLLIGSVTQLLDNSTATYISKDIKEMVQELCNALVSASYILGGNFSQLILGVAVKLDRWFQSLSREPSGNTNLNSIICGRLSYRLESKSKHVSERNL